MQFRQRPRAAAMLGALVLLAYAHSSAWAQTPEPLRLSSPPSHALLHADLGQAPEQTQTALGELLDVDGKANLLTVKTRMGETTFLYNDQTKVTGAQKGVAGLATMTGAQVTVTFKKEGPMKLATSIDVKAGSPQK
jgi:hypothetical protein